MPSMETSSTRTSSARTSSSTVTVPAVSAVRFSAMVAPLRAWILPIFVTVCRMAAGCGALRRPEMASTKDWFETVAEAQRRAKRRLPRSVYLAVLAGAEAGVTMHDNVTAFGELRFRPRVAGLPAVRELATTVMGQEVSLPVLISPTGVQARAPDRGAGRAPGRRGRGGAGRGRGGHGHGPVLVRVQAHRGSRQGDRQAALPVLLGRQPRRHPGPGAAGPGGRRRGPHHHP